MFRGCLVAVCFAPMLLLIGGAVVAPELAKASAQACPASAYGPPPAPFVPGPGPVPAPAPAPAPAPGGSTPAPAGGGTTPAPGGGGTTPAPVAPAPPSTTPAPYSPAGAGEPAAPAPANPTPTPGGTSGPGTPGGPSSPAAGPRSSGGSTPPSAPAGGGAPTFTGPVGGGTGPSAPSAPAAGGGTTPRGTAGGPAAPTPAPRPSSPGGGLTPGRGFARGVSGPARAKVQSVTPSWDLWWNLNKWEWLHIHEILHRRSGVSVDRDAWLGDSVINMPARASLTRDMIETTVMAALKRGLEDRHQVGRQAAVIALGKTKSPQALPSILHCLRNERGIVRESAVMALGMLGLDQARIYLEHLMTDSVRGQGLLGSKSQVPLSLRQHAAFALGLLGSSEARALLVETAEQCSSGTERRLGVFAVAALGALGDQSAAPALCRLLKDKKADPATRAAAAISLGKLRDRSPVILRVLQAAMGDRKPVVVQGAATALGTLARRYDDKAIKALAHCAKRHKDRLTQAMALMALARVGGDVAFETCLAAMSSRGLLAGYAPLALAFSARQSQSASEAAIALRRHLRRAKSAEVRRATMLALGIMGSKADVSSLTKRAVSAGNPQERASALAALGLIGDSAARSVLEAGLEDSAAPVEQAEAAIALALLGRRGTTVSTLLNVLSTTSNDYVRAACALGIGLMGTDQARDDLEHLAVGRNVAGQTRAFASGTLGLLAEPDRLPKLYRFRAHNLMWLDNPVMRNLLMLL